MKAPHVRLVVDAAENQQGISAAEYRRERQKLQELYGDPDERAETVAAKRDQAFANLLLHSGWTRTRLAEEEGKSEQWIFYRLQFGKFLGYATNLTDVKYVSISNLTEGRFRNYWGRTNKADDETMRFAAVIRLMQEPAAKTNRRKSPAPKTDEAREVVRPLVENGQPINRHEIAKEHGLTEATIQRAEYIERGRLEGMEEATWTESASTIDTSILSKTAQEKFAALERRLRAQYDNAFHARLQQEVKRHIDETLMPIYKEKLEKAERVMSFQSGKPFTEAEFKIMLRALHPDSAGHAEFRHAAWCLLKEKEYLLRPEKGNSLSEGLPTSLAEARRRNAG